MNKLIFLPIIPLFITGCVTTGSADCIPEIVVEKETVHVKVPESLLVIPTYGDRLDTDATQKDVSTWVVETEERMQQLERQLQAVKKFNDEPSKVEAIRDTKKNGKPTK